MRLDRPEGQSIWSGDEDRLAIDPGADEHCVSRPTRIDGVLDGPQRFGGPTAASWPGSAVRVHVPHDVAASLDDGGYRERSQDHEQQDSFHRSASLTIPTELRSRDRKDEANRVSIRWP